MDDPMSIFWMAFEDLKVGSERSDEARFEEISTCLGAYMTIMTIYIGPILKLFQPMTSRI